MLDMKRKWLRIAALLCAICAGTILVQSQLHRPGHISAPNSRKGPQIPKRLSVQDYQTQEDLRIMAWLQKVERNPASQSIDRHFLKPVLDDSNTRDLQVEGIEVTREQFPELKEIIDTCAQILHVGHIPRAFVSDHASSPIVTENYSDPVLVFQSSLLSRFKFKDSAELRFLVGRELGHMQAGHVRWLAVSRRAKALADRMTFLGEARGGTALLPVLRWMRQCEMTADNAGLVCAQDLHVCEQVLLRLTTGVDEVPQGTLNVDAYLRQNDGKELSKTSAAILLCAALGKPVPFTADRIRQIRRFQASARYQQIWN